MEHGYYKTIKEYPNGGKLVKWIPVTEEEIIDDLRKKRSFQCFPTINRGPLWYEGLTQEQREALKTWYKAWLDVTETKIIPEIPEILKNEIPEPPKEKDSETK